MKHCGTVWGMKGCSYLYAIFTEEHVYIGETGNLPPARWGSHLSRADSSFSEKLKNELEKYNYPSYLGEYVYIGLYCDVIDLEDKANRKFARLAIEEAVHREFLLNKNAFGKPKNLLSTSRSAPRHSFRFDVESFAKKAIEILINQYQSCGHHLGC